MQHFEGTGSDVEWREVACIIVWSTLNFQLRKLVPEYRRSNSESESDILVIVSHGIVKYFLQVKRSVSNVALYLD